MILKRTQPSAVLDLRRASKPALRNMRRNLLVAIAVIAVVAAAAAGWAWWHYPRPSLSAPQDLINAVSQNIVLPTGEQPVVATVTDTTKLADQPFLAQSQNGDRLLIYTKAKKVYIYRPSLHKLVDVGPVSISQSDLKQ